MKKLKQLSAYFTTTEKLLWGLSTAAIIISFAVFGGNGLLTLAASLVAWLKNPFEGNRSQVKVGKISGRKHIFMWVMAIAVTVLFYFILKALGTANIVPSTLSVTTSFIPVYLTLRRSPYYAAGYAANDVVLIVLWIMASFENTAYISVVVCFVAFLVNDLYGLVSWTRMEKAQASH